MADPGFVPEQGTREVEIIEVQIVRRTGRATGNPVRRSAHDRGRCPQNETVDDLDVDFAVHESSNYLVLDARTSRAGIDLGRFDKKRVRFKIRGSRTTPASTGDDRALEPTTGHLYHADPALPVRGVRRTEGPGAGRRPRRGGGRGPVTEPVADPATTQTKGTPPMLILLILFSVALAATAQLALKHGMNLVNDELSPDSLNGASLRAVSPAALRLGRAVPVRAVGPRLARGAVEGLPVVRLPVRRAHVRADPALRRVRAERHGAAATMGGRGVHRRDLPRLADPAHVSRRPGRG